MWYLDYVSKLTAVRPTLYMLVCIGGRLNGFDYIDITSFEVASSYNTTNFKNCCVKYNSDAMQVCFESHASAIDLLGRLKKKQDACLR